MSESCLSASARFIHVETNDGVVTLTGNVPTRDDSRTAERLAESVDGVRSVNNRLTIGK